MVYSCMFVLNFLYQITKYLLLFIRYSHVHKLLTTSNFYSVNYVELSINDDNFSSNLTTKVINFHSCPVEPGFILF